jgi:hypothetical protein
MHSMTWTKWRSSLAKHSAQIKQSILYDRLKPVYVVEGHMHVLSYLINLLVDNWMFVSGCVLVQRHLSARGQGGGSTYLNLALVRMGHQFFLFRTRMVLYVCALMIVIEQDHCTQSVSPASN